ncbi:MAG: PKD domain-containing protein, partial [Alphaproteobacteria bacterium]
MSSKVLSIGLAFVFLISIQSVASADSTFPEAAFTANITSGNAPLKVLFIDTGTGGTPTTWYWDFGDGINSKHAQTATHTFTEPGIYTVSLTVTNDAGSDTVTETNCITVSSGSAELLESTRPEASFMANITSGNAPLKVLFTDTGTGGTPTSWYWDFGDGINSKHAQTATHTFTEPGTYTVSLTETNDAGSDTVTEMNYITVSASIPPVASFYSPEAEKEIE